MDRRYLFAVGGVLFFAIIIIVWYFFYAKPIVAPSLSGTNNPLPSTIIPSRFSFLNWGADDTGSSTTEVTDPLKLPLVQVWNKPAAGQTFITQEILKEVATTTTQGTSTIEIRRTIRATSTVLVFIDKVTGYIYGYPLESGIPYQISNTVIPGVYDAYFFDNGKRVVIRYIDRERNTVTTLSAVVPNVSQTGSALSLEEINYLSAPVTSLASNARKDRVSYVVAGSNGSSVYTINAKGTSLVSSSPFKEWSLSYGGDSLFVTSKPSAYVEGITAKIPSFGIEITGKTGLMSNPSAAGDILSSMWSSSGLLTFISNDGGDVVLPIKTLATKCAWGRNDFLVCAIPRTLPRTEEGLPDDWFQGRVSFNDDLYIVDKNTGEQFPFYSFSEDEGTFDITNISVSPITTILSFTNKRDGTLWFVDTGRIIPEE